MKAENSFIYEINNQILNLICQVSREDQVVAKLIFGLPDTLVSQLARLDSKQIDSLSQTQCCLLTLRNCADEYYWQRIIVGSRKDSKEHILNLKALSMIRIASNDLLVDDVCENDFIEPSRIKEVFHDATAHS